MNVEKPFSQSCENNKEPILDLLRHEFAAARQVLEIGSGSGQHAVHFAREMPWLNWQPSDRAENLPGIALWLAEAALPNVAPALELDVEQNPWPALTADAVFSANTAHIMGWPQVERFFEGIGRLLPAGGLFCLYGPFNYGGQFTSPSNARFDQWLKNRDPASGIRNFEALVELGGRTALECMADYAMPVNNRLLVWRKQD